MRFAQISDLLNTRHLKALMVLALWLQLPSGFALAQSRVVTAKDSLDILNTLYLKVYQASPEQGIAHAQKARRIARKLNDRSWLAKSKLYIGNCYQALRMPDSAKVYLAPAAALYKSINNPQGHGEALLTLGEAHFLKQEFTKASEHFKVAASLLQHDKPLLRRAINDLGAVHGVLGKRHEAIGYFKQALAIVEDLGDLPAKSICFNNLGSMHLELKEYKQALDYYLASLEVQQTLLSAGIAQPGDDKLIDAYWHVGRTYTCLQNYPQAKRYLDLALGRAKEVGDAYKEIGATWYLAEYHSQQKDYTSAIELIKSTESIIAAHNFTWVYREFYERLADQYRIAGLDKEALVFKEKYVAFTDSLLKQKELEGIRLANAAKQDSLGLQVPEASAAPAETTQWQVGLLLAGVLLGTAFILLRYLKKGRQRVVYTSTPEPEAPQPAAPAPQQATVAPTVIPEPDTSPAPELKYVQAVKHSGEVIVPIENIYWFETKDKKYYLADGEELLETHYTMAELESMLAGNTNFIRINRSVIINAHFMFNYSPWEKDKYIVRMQDKAKTEFSMPRNRMKAMRQQFGLETAAV